MARWLDVFRLRLRSLLRRGAADHDLHRELRFHVDQHIAELMEGGMPRAEAERRARVAFGSVDSATEACRDTRRVNVVSNISQDLRYAVRGIVRQPLLLVAATASIALGAGANLAIFGLANTLLLSAPSSFDPDRLVHIRTNSGSHTSYRVWRGFRDSQVLVGIAGHRFATDLNWRGTDVSLPITSLQVTSNFFDVVGVPMAQGRGFTAGSVIGSIVLVNDTSRIVVGVMPPTFEFPLRTSDFWIPFQFRPEAFEDRSDTFLLTVARLKAGVSVEQARSEMRVIAKQLQQVDPRANRYAGATAISLRDEISQQSRMLLIGLVAAAAALLLIACANLANLLLTRSLSRQRELAVRSALGAGRERLVRQMFTESGLLAAGGGIAGIALAVSAVPLVARLVPTNLPIAEAPGIDFRMLAAAALSTLITAIGVGLIPAFRFSRHADAGALREGARAGTSRTTERLRSALVIAEVAASVVLLVSSGLLVRAMWKVQQTDPGFTAESVLTLRTALPMPKYQEIGRRQQFYDRVLSEVRALPGVSSAA